MFSGSKIRVAIDPMLFGFVVSSFVLTLVLFYQKRFGKFTWLEITIISLITICLTIWIVSGSPFLAFISSLTSEIIIGIYLIIKTYKYPQVEYNLLGYTGYFIVSIISVLNTRAWTIAEVGFAVSETILSFLILIPLLKKWWEEKSFKYLATLSILLIVANKKYN